MAGRVLCIELGQALTKVCEMDYGKANPSVYESFMFETPEGTMEDGYVRGYEAFGVAFKRELQNRNISTNKLIFAVYSNKIATREATIPLVKKEKILNVINANASDYFPIDLTGYQLGYVILDKVNTKEEKTMKLSIVAAPKDMLDTYLQLSNAIGMQLVDIDFAGNSIFQAIKDTSNKVQISIHMSEYSTLISVIDDGKQMMQRSIAYGVFGAIDSIKGLPEFNLNPNFTTMDAIAELTNRKYIDPEFSQGSTYSAGMSGEVMTTGSNRIVTESLRSLVGSVTRVIDYYISKNQGTEIDELKLTGLGSQFQGINELFANEIGIKTRQIIAIPSVSFERVGMGTSLSVMLLAIGANLAPMGLVPDVVAEQKKVASKQGSFVVGLIIMILCLVGSGVLLVIGFAGLKASELLVSSASKEIDDKIYIEEVEKKYIEIESLYADFMGFYLSTDNNNENLRAFIDEMCDKMPTNIVTYEAVCESDGITLKLIFDSKEASAYAVQQFYTFKSIEVVNVSSSSIKCSATEEATDESDKDGKVPQTTTARSDEDESESESETFDYDIEENCVEVTLVCKYKDLYAESSSGEVAQ